MGPPAPPRRDRIYVTVAVARMFRDAGVPMPWRDVHLPTGGTEPRSGSVPPIPASAAPATPRSGAPRSVPADLRETQHGLCFPEALRPLCPSDPSACPWSVSKTTPVAFINIQAAVQLTSVTAKPAQQCYTPIDQPSCYLLPLLHAQIPCFIASIPHTQSLFLFSLASYARQPTISSLSCHLGVCSATTVASLAGWLLHAVPIVKFPIAWLLCIPAQTTVQQRSILCLLLDYVRFDTKTRSWTEKTMTKRYSLDITNFAASLLSGDLDVQPFASSRIGSRSGVVRYDEFSGCSSASFNRYEDRYNEERR
ncbi:uncharacterized protein [Lolium perenne]|uniref:uncharacterized protein n=1 Tax=Lolium perenne TaxID=4522 RepID=UPI003A98DB97